MAQALLILDKLKEHGVTHAVGVPDNISRALYETLDPDPDIETIYVTREGEAFALASGLHIGGKNPIVLIQGTGFLESGDAIRGTAYAMAIPLVALIGYRGYRTLSPESKRVDSAATFLEPTLKAWEIPYFFLRTDEDVDAISSAFSAAQRGTRPTAVLLTEECT